jgi:hypothetical protein
MSPDARHRLLEEVHDLLAVARRTGELTDESTFRILERLVTIVASMAGSDFAPDEVPTRRERKSGEMGAVANGAEEKTGERTAERAGEGGGSRRATSGAGWKSTGVLEELKKGKGES